MRRFLGLPFHVLAIALAILLAARVAHAEEPAWRFVYDARVEGCPARAQVRGQVIARLGFDPFREEANAANELWIAIRTDERGLVAAVERRVDGTIVGERSLRASSDCGELAAAAALAGSILVDPTGSMAKRQAPRSEPAPPATSTHAENPWGDEGQLPLPPPAPQPSVQASVGGRIVGSLGLAPSPSLGFSVDGAIRREHLELRLEGRGDLPVAADPLPDGAGVATTLLIGSLVPCWTDRWLHLCGVFSAGGMFAKSEGLDPVERDATFFGAVGLRPMAAVSVYGPLKVIATVEGLLPLRQLSLTVRQKEVWASPVVAGAAGIGLEARFL